MEAAVQVRDHRAATLVGAVAGLSAPLVFHLLHLIQFLASSSYKPLAQPISALELEPLGWVQSLNFIVYGVLYIVFAMGLREAMEPNIGPWLHVSSGVGSIIVGLFPWTVGSNGPNEPFGHTLGIFMMFLLGGAGFLATWQPMRNDPRWRSLAYVSLATGILVLALFLVFGSIAQSKTSPFHDLTGLFQGVMANIWFLCTFIVALRLLKLARHP
jgi:hypothetical membrane protein